MNKTTFMKKINYSAFRLIVYGSLLIFGEILFYNITRIGRLAPEWISWFFQYEWLVDRSFNLGNIWNVPVISLYGQASLWMFLVYGTIGLFGVEKAYRKIGQWHWFFRGTIYMTIILVMECLWGWVLLGITGYDIWYYGGILSIGRYTSLAIAPMWFVVGILSENFIKAVDINTISVP